MLLNPVTHKVVIKVTAHVGKGSKRAESCGSPGVVSGPAAASLGFEVQSQSCLAEVLGRVGPCWLFLTHPRVILMPAEA